ncbi:hypothetical protein GYMLUDRAFT_313298 [Collybiopsis luxurians FD-317 M1]|nr:hypothetical protein GYMLUDRAFT_313298 [Collybiopsis luxurians FD-317 M1]
MSSDGSKGVKLANKKSAKQLNNVLKVVGQPPDAYICKFILAADLTEDARLQIWSVTDENMRELCVGSSMGWDPPDKKEELFHSLSRYILLSPTDNQDQIVGFCSFRFEFEDGEDLLYCYELQISRSHQRRGLGQYLMNLLEGLGKQSHMDKIMLTVLDKNKAALDFYQAAGFQLDPCSPTYHEDSNELDGDGDENDENVDYQILSKSPA